MNIYFVGLSDVPYKKRAIDIRLLSFAKLFNSLGHSVKIINRLSNSDKCDMYIPNNIIIKHVCKAKSVLSFIWSIIKEPFFLLKENKNEKIDVIHIASGHYFDLLIYKIISKITKSKLIYHYCEYRSAFVNQNIYHRINGRLMNTKGPKLWDGAICISHFLEDKAKEYNNTVKTIIVPPICDFNDFINIEPYQADKKYILFCGSVGFEDTIDLINKSYQKSSISNSHDLYFVLSGSDTKISSVKSKSNINTKFYKNLEYNELISLFKGASALLIPLRNTIQDIARFPNKICEYVASKGLVITTQNGEMPYYFIDKENGLLAKNFDVDSYKNTLDWLNENINDIDKIKEKSYNVGINNFNIRSYEDKIKEFLNSL